MERLHRFLVVLFGIVSCSLDCISGSVLEVTVRPGENITLYCNCKLSTGEYIVWYRNCSHENQPSLVLYVHFFNGNYDTKKNRNTDYMNILPRFQFVRNDSSDSYDLLIMNVTDSDEGLYYCGTRQKKVEERDKITYTDVYRYGNITTRINVNSSKPHHDETPQEGCVCWTLLFSLCSAVVSSLLSSLVMYRLCKKKEKEPQVDQQISETRGQTRVNQDEDVCYAALEIRQASQRPKKRQTESSDFSTYSAINTSRM